MSSIGKLVDCARKSEYNFVIMTSALTTLLQLTASLLLAIQNNNQLPVAAREQAIAGAGRVIQLGTQALARVDFPQSPSGNIWPNAMRLRDSLYLDRSGRRVPIGKTVQLLDEYISFGDLNNDGLDDAVVLVRRFSANKKPKLAIALSAMLNQGGILFNIADVDLGERVEVYDHRIEAGRFIVDMKVDQKIRRVFRYGLLGNKLVEI